MMFNGVEYVVETDAEGRSQAYPHTFESLNSVTHEPEPLDDLPGVKASIESMVRTAVETPTDADPPGLGQDWADWETVDSFEDSHCYGVFYARIGAWSVVA